MLCMLYSAVNAMVDLLLLLRFLPLCPVCVCVYVCMSVCVCVCVCVCVPLSLDVPLTPVSAVLEHITRQGL
jgi:hypothetical protein